MEQIKLDWCSQHTELLLWESLVHCGTQSFPPSQCCILVTVVNNLLLV